ncbi:hypothetical protein AUQ39_11960 [Lacticaseibacillus casei]|nr:hypothetical protein AAW28_13210 [Lacticaseibacillus casei]OLS05669.1 hypothetical protein AUQ39_11960 [Lacticaseibacillus casei]
MVTAALLVGLAVAFLPGQSVSANNHGDTSWSFWLGNNQQNSYTGGRMKYDRSYAYIRNDNGSNTGVNAWVQYSNGKECGSPKTRTLPGEAHYIWNNAFEDAGYKPVEIRLAIEQDRSLWISLHASGAWSPDSV